MSDLVALFDAFYERLLLRDVFGKVIPGLVVLVAIAASASTPSRVLAYADSMSFGVWVIVLGAAWIVAFSIQAFGEKTGLIQYYASKWNDEQFYSQSLAFEACADPVQRQQLERFIVIKEACGNGYLAASFALALFVLDRMVESGWSWSFLQGLKDSWHLLLVAVGLVYFLAKMHFIHVERQSTYLETVVRATPSAKQPP